MSLITLVGIGIYMAGHGLRGVPNNGLIGSVLMVLGGVLVIVGALV